MITSYSALGCGLRHARGQRSWWLSALRAMEKNEYFKGFFDQANNQVRIKSSGGFRVNSKRRAAP